MRIDVIAPDAATYDADPLSAEFSLTKTALEQLQEAHRTGDTVTFGPDDVSEVRSKLFKIAGLPWESLAIESLTVSPSKDLLSKRLRLAVTFAKNDLKELFPLIEFQFLKVGTEQFQIESCYPPLPLRLTITLPRPKGRGSLNVAFQYEGHDIRRVLQGHRALQILTAGGRIELTDLESDCHLGTLRDISSTGIHNNPWFDEFLSTLQEISKALKVQIFYKRPTVQDAENVKVLNQVIRTGELLLPGDSVVASLTHEQLRIARDALAVGNGLHLPFEKPPKFATVFGQTLDLGPYSVFLNVSEIMPEEASPEAKTLPVKLTLTRPVLYRFPRFLPDGNPAQERPASDI